MEVLVGSTFGIDVPSSPAYVREAAQDNRAAVASCLGVGSGSRICAPEKAPVEDSSDSSSSIGAPDDSDEEEEEEYDASFKGDADKDEAQSKFRGRPFGSLASLEESLPIKRGLSNHFSGKSKSFANLSDVSTVNDLVKGENPLNKRRRILIASKWSKKSFYSWPNPKSMPLLTLKENDEENQAEKEEHQESQEKEVEEEQEEEENDSDNESCRFGLPNFHEKRLKSFKTRSCFSLADLQEHNRRIDEEDHHQH